METVRVPHYYPVTIIKTRYGGTYEGYRWAAFACDPERVPDAATDDDVTCAEFWGDWGRFIGRGATPDEAYENLTQIDEPMQVGWDAERKRFYLDKKPWGTIHKWAPDPPDEN